MNLFHPNLIKTEVGKFEKNPETGTREIPVYYLFPTNVVTVRSPHGRHPNWSSNLPTTVETYRPTGYYNYLKVRVGSITRKDEKYLPSGYRLNYELVDTVVAGIRIVGSCVSPVRKGSLTGATYYSTLAEAKEVAKRSLREDKFEWEYERVVTLNFSPEGDIREFWKALSVWDGVDGCAVISVDAHNHTVVVGNPPPPTDIYHDEGQWYIGPAAPYSRNAALRP